MTVCWTTPGLTCIIYAVSGPDGITSAAQVKAADDDVGLFSVAGLGGLVLWAAVLAILVTVACYAIKKIRPKPAQKEPEARQWLLKLREMNDRGELSDEEFRTINTTLEARLRDELNDNGQEG